MTLDPITIRPARREEARTIRRMVRGAGLDPTSLHWPNFLVAEDAGRIVGLGQVKPYWGGRELGSLVVLRAYRGRGIGGALIRALIEREPGELCLLCRDRLEPYYARFGFRRVGWRELRGVIRLKYVFSQSFRLLLRIRIIAMKRPARDGRPQD